jgi:hypothetical protein
LTGLQAGPMPCFWTSTVTGWSHPRWGALQAPEQTGPYSTPGFRLCRRRAVIRTHGNPATVRKQTVGRDFQPEDSNTTPHQLFPAICESLSAVWVKSGSSRRVRVRSHSRTLLQAYRVIAE